MALTIKFSITCCRLSQRFGLFIDHLAFINVRLSSFACGLYGGRMSRCNKAKDSATWHVRARPQSSVMRFDNRPADRQPKSHTVRFRAVESLEYALKIRRCEAWT